MGAGWKPSFIVRLKPDYEAMTPANIEICALALTFSNEV
jgi:hypothetical protein